MNLDDRTGSTSRRKWLPMIDADACSGCGMCVDVCEHGCLDMVWSFATLLRPQECGSEGHCMEACPEDVIAMGWVAVREAAVTEEDGRAAATSGADASPQARALLTEMLACIRHSASTPLYFGIDSVQIVAAALRKVDPAGLEPRRLCADFD
jgi:NAD-dependent dihydropyrimidine dehydrogenase PreA subunit